MDKFSDFTKEEILNSPRLLYNRKRKYSQILLFPDELTPNENFRETIAVGHKGNSENKFELIGRIPDVDLIGVSGVILTYSSVGAIIVQSFNNKLVVYGRSKDDDSTLMIFSENNEQSNRNIQ